MNGAFGKISLVILILLSSCNTSKQKPNKVEFINYTNRIESNLSNEKIEKFKNLADSLAVLYAIKEGFIDDKSFLVEKSYEYLESLEVNDISHKKSILLKIMHLRVNGDDIELDKILENYYALINKKKSLEEKYRKIANDYFQKYDIGQEIVLRMPIENGTNAIQYVYPDDSDWVKNDSIDLLIECLIKEKSTGDYETKFFTLEILNKNKDNVTIFSESLIKGDTFVISLENSTIE